MKQIRRGVFETNSSSTHSVSMRKGDNMSTYGMTPDPDDNKIHVSFGEYGWECETYNHPYDKLSYLCTMAIEIEGRRVTTQEEFFDSEGFKMINDSIAQYCNCDGVLITSDIHTYTSNIGYTYLEHDGYIDHQSCEEYETLKEYLDEYDIDVIQYVFHSGVCIHTSNDNI